MRLSKDDSALFYSLFFPLLEYVNKKYKVNRKVKMIVNAKSLNPNAVKEIADKVWEDVSIIDDYLLASTNLCEAHKEILRSWKRRVSGQFILERHLKGGSIFIFNENALVFKVSGIVSSWDEMFPREYLPVVMEATLIPFKEVIITDGLVLPYNVAIGQNMKERFKEIYMSAKNSNEIISKILYALIGSSLLWVPATIMVKLFDRVWDAEKQNVFDYWKDPSNF